MTESLKENLYTRHPLKCREDGTFRILMVSDIHICDDMQERVKNVFNTLIEAADPDLLLLGGDQIGANDGCASLESLHRCIEWLTELPEAKKIPWAHVYGNHDAESMPNEEQAAIYESFPMCITKRGPADISGTGNYVLPIYANDGKTPVFNVWGLDSGRYIHSIMETVDPDQRNLFLTDNFTARSDYAYFPLDQMVWYDRSSRELEEHFGRKIPSIMYFHIPLCEHALIPRNPEETHMVGHCQETVCCGEINSGMFGVLLSRGDVRGVYCGHDHVNDYEGTYCGIRLGYDSGVCYDPYNDDETRGGRLFVINQNDPAHYESHIIYHKDYINK